MNSIKTISKTLPPSEAKRIIEIYSKFELEHLPKLISHNIREGGKIELEFEILKKMIAKYSLERNIANGKKNKLDTSFEERILSNYSEAHL